MRFAEIPDNDTERLVALAKLHILDSPREDAYDRITALAALLCDVPMAAINFVDRDRQWFKSAIGLGEALETPRETGFCAHAVLSTEAMVVPDAARDPRFADNPFVAGEPRIRFYLGIPLVETGGLAVGTLCVLDRRPRRLTRRQTGALTTLAELLVTQLRQRRQFMGSLAGVAELLDQSRDEVYLLATDQHRCYYANRRARWRTGYSMAELETLEIRAVFPDYAPEENGDADTGDVSTTSTMRTAEHIARGGERYPVEARLSSLRIGDSTMRMIVARELGEQRAIEITLEREREFSKGLLENLSEGVVACDVEGRLTVVNRTMRDWYPGLSDLTAFHQWSRILSIFEDESSSPLAEDQVPLVRALRGERVRAARLVISAPGLAYRHVLVNADPLLDSNGRNRGGVAVMTDMTSLYVTEQHLRQAREQYQTLIESSPDMVLVHCDGVIVYINWTGVRILGGNDPGDFIGRLIIDLLHPSFHEIAHQRVREMRATGKVAKPLEELFFRVDGSTVPLEVAATPISHNGRCAIQVVARDMSERYRAIEALRTAEQRFRSLFENAAEGIFQITPQGDFTTANPAMAGLLCKDATELLEKPGNWRNFAHYLSREVLDLLLARTEREGNVVGFEAEVVKDAPGRVWISINMRAVRDDAGSLQCYEGSALDVTEVKRHQRTLEHQATHDLLTNLPNRNLLDDRLLQSMATADRHGTLVAVAFVDLDNFKDINDTFGHRVGDAVLTESARRLSGTIRAGDTVARVGGDEFVVVAGDLQSIGEMESLMQRLLRALAAPIAAVGTLVDVTCSAGVSIYPTDAAEAEALVRYADMAMYRAKQQGRDCVHYFTSRINAEVQARVLLERALRGAIASDELRLVYQPQVDLLTRRVTKCEALLRWSSRKLGPQQPADFIGVAEETSMILQIGEWVIRQACMQLRTWHMAGFDSLSVSINLSPRQLRDRNLLTVIAVAIREIGIDPRFLEFELTETMLINGTDEMKLVLRSLREMGVRLSIDDFGTGYSSLKYLREFPIDGIKIDKSFIAEIDKSPNDELIVKTMIALAVGLKLNVVAEGVETQDQLAFLIAQRVRVMQGYLFSRPLEVQQMFAYLKRNYAAGAMPLAVTPQLAVAG